METITQALKNGSSVSELTKLYKFSKDEGLMHIFLDHAIIYKSYAALKLIIEMDGVSVLNSPYKS